MAGSPPNPRDEEAEGAAAQKTLLGASAAELPSRLQFAVQAPGAPGPSGIKQCFRTVKAARRVPTLPRKPDAPAPARARPHLKRHPCAHCDKRFSSPGKLNQHLLSHTGELPFSCNLCDKRFNSKFKLVRHSLIHSEARAFACNVCSKTFNRKDHLTNHVRVHNPVKKLYTCERSDCHKSYSSLLSYRKHAALHSAEEGNLQCKICDETFATHQEIVYHLKVHTGSRTVKNETDKKFTCQFCERRFFTAKDVRRHLVVHTGTRDFLCPHCPQKFGRKDHLVRHVKNAHPEESWRSAAVGTSSDPMPELPPDDFVEYAIDSQQFEIWKPDLKVKSEQPHTETKSEESVPFTDFRIEEPQFEIWKPDKVKSEQPHTETQSEESVPFADFRIEEPQFEIWKPDTKDSKSEGGRTRVPSSDIIVEMPSDLDIKVEPLDIKLEQPTSPESVLEYPVIYIPAFQQTSENLPYLTQTPTISDPLESQLLHSNVQSLLMDPGEGTSGMSSGMLGLMEGNEPSYSQSQTEERRQQQRVSLPAFKQVFHTSQSPKPPPPAPQ